MPHAQEKCLVILRSLANGYEDGAHQEADAALLECIDCPEITEAFHNVPKWYA